MPKIVITKNRLKEKVGTGGFKAEAIQKAQQSLDENTVDFKPIAKVYIEELRHVIVSYRNRPHASTFGRLLDPLTQLKAQGSFFKYSSISALTGVIVDCLDTVQIADDDMIELVEAYEKAASVLIKVAISDEHAPPCIALVAELTAACNRHKAKHGK